MATGKQLSTVMRRLQAADSVEVELMQRSVDEAFMAATEEMKRLLLDDNIKPAVKVLAANNIVASGNYLVRRRSLNNAKQVKVVIGPDMQIQGAEVTVNTEADFQPDEDNLLDEQ